MAVDNSRSEGDEGNIRFRCESGRVNWSTIRRAATSRLEIIIGFRLRKESRRRLTEFANKNPELTLLAISLSFTCQAFSAAIRAKSFTDKEVQISNEVGLVQNSVARVQRSLFFG